jgi:hypothetical protein
MGFDSSKMSPAPARCSLRVRSVPQGIRISNSGWKIGPVSTLLLGIFGLVFVRNSYQFCQGGWQLLARQGFNAAVIQAMGRAATTQLALPLAVIIMVLGIAAIRSCLSLRGYWYLLLEWDQWRLCGLFGLRVFGEVNTSEIAGIVVAGAGQVMAECEGRWVPLSGTLSTADASWLREVLVDFLKKPVDQKADVSGEDPLAAATAGSCSDAPEWPPVEPSLAGDIFPPSHVAAQPGTILRFELEPPARLRTGLATCAIVLLTIWLASGFFAILAGLVVNAIRRSPIGWIGLVVQGIIVLALLAYSLRRRRKRGLNPHLEISEHPMRLGEIFELCLRQAGPVSLESIRVWLVCEEKASYTDGTATCFAAQDVFRGTLWSADQRDIAGDELLSERFTVTLPAHAMHSFQSSHNWISWKFVVEEQVARRWRKWRQDYPVVVLPCKP